MTTAVALLALEVGLRLFELTSGGRLPGERLARSQKLTPGTGFGGQSVNSLGYWDDELATTPAQGVFRVAVLGDGVTLSGPCATNCLSRVELTTRGIEICHFGLPRAGPFEFSLQLAEVARFSPHLVLVFVSAGDLIGQTAARAELDWRRVRLARLAARWWPANASALPGAEPAIESLRCASDYEDHLRRCGRRLSACRVPIDAGLDGLWNLAIRQLNDLCGQCQRRHLPLVLVVTPAEFQVDRRLSEILKRRAGLNSAQLDLEMPQRRLAQFAQARGLPLIDLLPYFRASEVSPFMRHSPDWNDRGHALAGQVLAGWLQSRLGGTIAAADSPTVSTAMNDAEFNR
jgi:hypothetical protein